MRRVLLAGVCAAALVAATPNSSYSLGIGDDFYLSLFGGASIPDGNYSMTYASGPWPYSFDTDVGFVVGGALGVTNVLLPGLRAEIELSYFENGIDSWVSTAGSFPGGGEIASLNLLGNLWYDIPTGTTFTPYVGGGIGVAFTKANQFNTNGGFGSIVNDKATDFAFQAGGGVKVNVSEMIDLDFGYRFRGVFDPDWSARGIAGLSSPDGKNLYVHTVQGGFTVKLN